MEIARWRRNKKEGRAPGFMIKLNPDEAFEVIKSIAAQLSSKNLNVGRVEFWTEKGEYFSICVNTPPKTPITPPDELEVDFIYNRIDKESKDGRLNLEIKNK